MFLLTLSSVVSFAIPVNIRGKFDAGDSTSILLTVRYFAALNFTSSNKAFNYITNKTVLAVVSKSTFLANLTAYKIRNLEGKHGFDYFGNKILKMNYF